MDFTAVFVVAFAALGAQIGALGGACVTRNPVGIAAYAVAGFVLVFGALELVAV